MLDDAQQVLAQSARLAFRDIVLGAPDVYTSTLDALTQMYDSTLDSVRAALLSEFRGQCARLFPRYRLPNELWCLIWSQLPQEDRIRVSQVCSDWRSLALSSPAVWSDLIFITSRHASHLCTCHDCLLIPRDAYHCPTCDDVFPSFPPNVWTGSSNLQTIVALLPRTLAHPLSLTVCAETPDCPFTGASELILLAEALGPHMHHLSSLRCYVNSDDNLYDFMSALQYFPALTRLVCQMSLISYDEEETLGHDASFPSLQSVELYGSFQNLTNRAFSTVRSLACDYVSTTQFLGVLSSFPELSSLHVRMRPTRSEGAFVDALSEDVYNSTKVIACITVSGISACIAEAVLIMFHQPSHVACGTHRNGVHLSCEAHEGNEFSVRLIVTDERQRLRTLYCHARDACEVWAHLAPTALRSVTIDLRLPYATFAALLTRTPSTEELVLILPGQADIAALVTRIASGSLQSPLKFDTLRTKSTGPRVYLSGEDTDTILAWLQAPLSLLELQ
ncbi:hypothetical protein EXIGLDRAFT_758595 [Exidia glandulosa HHB12029]|uniref:F-box domain-containing protein n=1 Tax=Exidia glandulosa HHB12029 TaxID=1314781 RepID=A0A165R054_EXIGL|nr:hypothetical protein EXIGLDRAFT_758595 [Exidia glandulosa HHB12029]